jgi:tetratricopeptide (TPR) repeat protein
MDAPKSPEKHVEKPVEQAVEKPVDRPVPESLQNLIDLKIEMAKAQILDRVHLVDRQVADLQIDTVQVKKPWYRDASILISVAALLFSLISTAFSQRQVNEQRRQGYRAELRSLIQRISEIPRQGMEYTRDFKDAGTLANLNGLLQAENAMIARQAREIMDRLPGEVSASEYSLVGLAMTNSNLSDEAIQLFDKAIATAENSNDKVSALRGKAALLIATGDLEGGQTVFGQALKIFDEYPTGSEYYEHTTHIDTHLYWAGADFSQGQCEEFKTHLDAARRHAAQLAPGPITAQKSQQIEGLANFVGACVSRVKGGQQPGVAMVQGMGAAVP